MGVIQVIGGIPQRQFSKSELIFQFYFDYRCVAHHPGGLATPPAWGAVVPMLVQSSRCAIS
jgi:hypothetical protein